MISPQINYIELLVGWFMDLKGITSGCLFNIIGYSFTPESINTI